MMMQAPCYKNSFKKITLSWSLHISMTSLHYAPTTLTDFHYSNQQPNLPFGQEPSSAYTHTQTADQTRSTQFTCYTVLWHCWLGGRKEWWGAGVVVYLEQGADLHMAQLMPLPLTDSCFSKIQIGYTFLVPAHLGSPGRGPLNGYVLPATHTARWYACCFQTRTRSLKIYCTIVLYAIPKNQ